MDDSASIPKIHPFAPFHPFMDNFYICDHTYLNQSFAGVDLLPSPATTPVDRLVIAYFFPFCTVCLHCTDPLPFGKTAKSWLNRGATALKLLPHLVHVIPHPFPHQE